MRRLVATYTLPGLAVGLVLACLSFTPSLLPRPPMFQALVAGINLAIGYGVGVAGAWVWRAFADREPRTPRRPTWWALGAATTVLVPASLILGVSWQRDAHELARSEPDHPAWMLLVVPVTVVLGAC